MYFTDMADLVCILRKDHEAGIPGKGHSYYKSSLVVVDEICYTPITRKECNLSSGSSQIAMKKPIRLSPRIKSLVTGLNWSMI